MRRLAIRILFAALVASGSVLLVLACVRSVHIAEAQTRPGHGGGGAGGVALQATSPGVTQTGNTNISGVARAGQFSPNPGGYIGCRQGSDGCSNNTVFYAVGNGPGGFIFDSPLSNYTINTPWVSFNQQGLRGPQLFRFALSFDTSQAALPATFTGAGLVAPNLTLMTTGGIVTSDSSINIPSGDLWQWKNNAILKAHLDFAGNLTANGATLTTPLAQASGGTGAGAVTCTAGQFLTSNGTAYSCAAPSSASAYTTWNSGPLSRAALAGSLCDVFSIASTGLTAGQGCLASANQAFGNVVALTLTCEVTSPTNINYRICNTGSNTYTPPPTTTYYARVFP